MTPGSAWCPGIATGPEPAGTGRNRNPDRPGHAANAAEFGRRSGRVPSPASVQLVEVVHHADQGPIKAHLPAAPQQELTEAAGLLDLTEHRFDRDLAEPVAAFVSAAPQATPHRRTAAARPHRAGAGRRLRPVLPAADGDISPDVALLQRLQVVL